MYNAITIMWYLIVMQIDVLEVNGVYYGMHSFELLCMIIGHFFLDSAILASPIKSKFFIFIFCLPFSHFSSF